MLVEELALPVSIYPDIRIQPNNLTAPHSLVPSRDDIAQAALLPQCFSEPRVGDLEAVIYTDRFADLRFPWGCGERDGILEKGQVRVAERRREQLGYCDDLGTEHAPQF